MVVLIFLISRFIFHEHGLHIFNTNAQPITPLQITGIILTGVGLIIAIVAIVSAFFIQWLAVPLSFLVYVILSLLNKQPKSV